MRKCALYAIGPIILTIFFAVQCIMRLEESSGSIVFYLWYVLPLCLLILSFSACFLKKWIYTVPLIATAMVAIFFAADGDAVLGILLFIWILLYFFSGKMLQLSKRVKERT